MGVQLAVESLSSFAWNRCPACSGMGVQLAVEYARTGMALAYLTGDYAMKAIADAFDVHYTTVSRAVRAYESKQDQK